MVIAIVVHRKDPISDMMYAKNGIASAITTVLATNNVLITVPHISTLRDFHVSGRNSSRPAATGVSVSAYFANGFSIVATSATFVAACPLVRFNVTCDWMLSPNIKNPITAVTP